MPGRATPDAAVGDMRFEHLHDVLGVGVAHSRLSRILSESVWSAQYVVEGWLRGDRFFPAA